LGSTHPTFSRWSKHHKTKEDSKPKHNLKSHQTLLLDSSPRYPLTEYAKTWT
jgi:hypothetical protein